MSAIALCSSSAGRARVAAPFQIPLAPRASKRGVQPVAIAAFRPRAQHGDVPIDDEPVGRVECARATDSPRAGRVQQHIARNGLKHSCHRFLVMGARVSRCEATCGDATLAACANGGLFDVLRGRASGDYSAEIVEAGRRPVDVAGGFENQVSGQTRAPRETCSASQQPRRDFARSHRE